MIRSLTFSAILFGFSGNFLSTAAACPYPGGSIDFEYDAKHQNIRVIPTPGGLKVFLCEGFSVGDRKYTIIIGNIDKTSENSLYVDSLGNAVLQYADGSTERVGNTNTGICPEATCTIRVIPWGDPAAETFQIMLEKNTRNIEIGRFNLLIWPELNLII